MTSISTTSIDVLVPQLDGAVAAAREAVSLASTGDDARRAELVDSLDRRVAVLGKVVANPGGLLQRAVDLVAATETDNVVKVIDALRQVALPPP